MVAMLMTGTLSAQEITGPWSGSMSVSGFKLRLVFHIQRSEQGLSATLDSPDQGAKERYSVRYGYIQPSCVAYRYAKLGGFL